MDEPIIKVNGPRTSFRTDDGVIPVVNSIDFHVNPGEVLGIVGESGCGKSVTSLSIMGLVPSPAGKVEGEILFKGENIANASEAKMRKIRGNDIAMIFQEPMTSLNPVFTIGEQLVETLRIHKNGTRNRPEIERWKC